MNVQKPCIIENNYIHHNSDNGITMEYGDDSENVIISGITISGNLFEYNGEDIQIVSFDSNMKERGCAFRDILVDNNYMLYACSGSRNYCQAEMVDGMCQSYYILKCGDFSTPLYSENLVIRNNILYSESVRSYFCGGNIGYEPPVFENNTLYLKPCVQMPENSGAVALWANDAYAGEADTEFLWVFDDHVWPEEFGVKDWNSFLNEYLGIGNTLVFVGD